MIKLNKEQISNKISFINDYISSENAATGSKFDSNANVSNKNIATLSAELYKDYTIQLNRKIISDRINKLFGQELADEYIRQLETHEIYTHDESSLAPYCTSITLYPFLLEGLKGLGGETKAPKHLKSFNGGFINLVFAVASQFAGAVATVEWLMYFDHFARKEYGLDYLNTHVNIIEKEIQSVVYALNQPAAARGFQSVFWNISIYDRPYFEAMFGNFVFPDGDKPDYESTNKLQKFFMKWFNKERTKAVLTFPVVTTACLNNGSEFVDQDFGDFLAEELSEGNSFFIFNSDNPASLSSCCRLRNSVEDQINEFSYSLGAGGVSTGSMNVITINLNRLIQDKRDLKEQVQKIHKYQLAFRDFFKELESKKMLPVYDCGYINMNKQFLTIGINGLVEAAEFLGYKISNNPDYLNWVSEILKIISDENKIGTKLYGVRFNTELVPGENLGAKHAIWDRKAGYQVPRDIYNSYFYIVEDSELSPIDKIVLHGEKTTQYLDGGSALHLNLEEIPDKEQFKKLLEIAIREKCEYLCFNTLITICNTCENIDKHTLQKCPKCGSTDLDYATRIIGYLKRISSFSKSRQLEAAKRFYHKSC